jgi:FkbM family methyltransferase
MGGGVTSALPVLFSAHMNPWRKIPLRRTLGLSFLLAVILGTFYLGSRFGRYYEHYSLVYSLPTQRNIQASFFRVFGLQRSYAQSGQDLWVALATAPGKRDGFYVDVGSADGRFLSNTKLLDDMGWKGICIDPFPMNMQRRTCKVFSQPVFSESGKKMSFRVAGMLSGIDSDLGKYRGATSTAETVELVTATLDEILAKGHAPNYIDYMSIDIEGAEYDALLGLSLDRYQIGTFTIEHNFETKKRDAIRTLLEGKGYVRVRVWEVEDWYVHPKLASRIPGFVAYCSKAPCDVYPGR